MKRFSSCDSSPVTLLFPPQPQSQSEREMMAYGGSREFQAMLEGLEEEDMAAAAAEEEEERWGKKRRLRAEQVQALERVFEEENKLEPERKVKIAGELGLEPRQVAIWFQNRRARFKTKQLERDFKLLKATYDSLHLDFNKLQQERDALLSEVKGLKEKLLIVEENSHSSDQCTTAEESCLLPNHHHHLPPRNCGGEGSSESDDSSSGGGLILDDYSFNLQPLMAARSSAIYVQPPQYVKMEAEQQQIMAGVDHEECCNTTNIFSLDHPPNLYWYCPAADHRYQ